MKIIFLNTWGGECAEALKAYVQEHSEETDIFCFQEAYEPVAQLLSDVLGDFVVYDAHKKIADTDDFPQATYVRKGITVHDSGTLLDDAMKSGYALYVEVEQNGARTFVCNVHGASRPIEKRDCEGRITQSEEIIAFFANKQRVVIGGDFNLLPDTKSIELFSEHGYSNLIKKYQISTTRNHLAWDRFTGPQFTKQYHADYVFLSPEVQEQSFVVPDNRISDHLPLELEIN